VVSLWMAALSVQVADAGQVKIADVTASSEYRGGGADFPPRNVKDNKSATPWFEGDRGNGVGSWIEVDLGGEHTVTHVRMMAGDWSTAEKWRQANRPKELAVRWSDGTEESWMLGDERTVQIYRPPTPKATSSIRFKINGLYTGSAFPDAAISEIQVFDTAPSKTVKIRSAKASSEFPADSEGSYTADQAFDGVNDTYWCEGNEEGDGVGEWLEFDLGGAKKVSVAKICAGICASPKANGRANSPTTATLQFSDGSTEKAKFGTLAGAPSKITFDTPHTTSCVRLRIDSIKKGSDYNDACVSEVTFLP
jgi:hypothetical protein